MKLILLGPPGAGKGTQAEALTIKCSIPMISTGEILRDAIKKQTSVGMEAKTYMDAGDLVPDDVIISIVIDRLNEKDCESGYILDGVPRTLVQAKALDERGIKPDAVLSLEIPDEVILERLGGRRVCPDCKATYHLISNPPKKDDTCDKCSSALSTRNDDKQETILHRLQEYHNETEPLKEYYNKQGVLRTVDGTMTIAQTTDALFAAIATEISDNP